jgi:hypothetical protein
LLNEIKLFIENKGRNSKNLKDGGWITDLMFIVAVTGHLNNLNKELQCKNKLSTDTDLYENMEAFKVKL